MNLAGKDAYRVELFGTPLHAMTMAQVLDLTDSVIAERKRLLIAVVNAAKLVNMRRDAGLRRSVLESDIILADGMSVVWASRLLGVAVPERVPGIDLMIRLLERGNERGHRVFCLGATEEVVRTVATTIRRDYPNIDVVGFRNGYFSEQDGAAVAEEIAAARPDVLFVAMTSPKKENFLSRWGEHMAVPVCHGVGGSFDVIAGKVQRAPERWQRLGLEWLYRVRQEPRRMWRRYLVTNTLFLGMLAKSLATRWWSREEHRVKA